MTKEKISLNNARQRSSEAAKKTFDEYCLKVTKAIDSKDMDTYFAISKEYIIRKAIKLAQKDNYKIDQRDMEDIKQEGYIALWAELTGFEEFKYTEKQHIGYTTDKQGRKVKAYEPTGKIIIYEKWYELPEQLLFAFLAYRVKAAITRAIRSQGRLNYSIGLEQLSERGYIDYHLNALERRVNTIGNIETLSCLLNKTEYNFLIAYLQDNAISKDNNRAWANIKDELRAMAYRLIDQNDLRDMCNHIKNQRADKLAALQLAVENKQTTACKVYEYLRATPEISKSKYAELIDIATSKGLAKMLKKIS